jgi:hypothetical protein
MFKDIAMPLPVLPVTRPEPRASELVRAVS